MARVNEAFAVLSGSAPEPLAAPRADAVHPRGEVEDEALLDDISLLRVIVAVAVIPTVLILLFIVAFSLAVNVT